VSAVLLALGAAAQIPLALAASGQLARMTAYPTGLWIAADLCLMASPVIACAAAVVVGCGVRRTAGALAAGALLLNLASTGLGLAGSVVLAGAQPLDLAAWAQGGLLGLGWVAPMSPLIPFAPAYPLANLLAPILLLAGCLAALPWPVGASAHRRHALPRSRPTHQANAPAPATAPTPLASVLARGSVTDASDADTNDDDQLVGSVTAVISRSRSAERNSATARSYFSSPQSQKSNSIELVDS
jgi:hypothetical protein